MLIVDTNNDITSRIPRFKAASDDGKVCFGRYISQSTHEEKVAKPAEMHAIADANCSAFLIFESTAKRALSGTGGGHADGTFALPYAKLLGAPIGAVIYPAVDFDALPNELDVIIGYFQAFSAALAGYYNLGAYASGYVTTALYNRGIIDYRWITMSGGFHGSRQAVARGLYELHQLLDKTIAGLDIDPDQTHVANGNFGAFVPFAALPPPQPAVV